MSGTNIVGAGLVAVNPGPAWHIKGTGDFFGDGNTDIVFQNNDGSVALWDMNGTNIIGAGIVAVNPGPTWHIKGTGNYRHRLSERQRVGRAVGHERPQRCRRRSCGGEPRHGVERSSTIICGFIYSTSANETLAATPAAPDEFVFTSFAAGSHTIRRIQPGCRT